MVYGRSTISVTRECARRAKPIASSWMVTAMKIVDGKIHGPGTWPNSGSWSLTVHRWFKTRRRERAHASHRPSTLHK